MFTIDMTKYSTSSQKMLYNIMVTNIELVKLLGGNQKELEKKIFSIDPKKDLGVIDSSNPKIMDPEKC